jgi:hypothetical protein
MGKSWVVEIVPHPGTRSKLTVIKQSKDISKGLAWSDPTLVGTRLVEIKIRTCVVE